MPDIMLIDDAPPALSSITGSLDVTKSGCIDDTALTRSLFRVGGSPLG